MSRHPNGRKPPNPQRAPKSHGRKPPAPKPHSNSGSSSGGGTRTLVVLAVLVFGVPSLVTLTAIAWMVAQS